MYEYKPLYCIVTSALLFYLFFSLLVRTLNNVQLLFACWLNRRPPPATEKELGSTGSPSVTDTREAALTMPPPGAVRERGQLNRSIAAAHLSSRGRAKLIGAIEEEPSGAPNQDAT